MTSPEQTASDWVNAFLPRVDGFLQEECDCGAVSASELMTNAAKEQLLDVTAMLSVGEPLNMVVAFTFDQGMIDHLVDAYAGLELGVQDELTLYRGETGSDILNNIVGNTTADFQQSGRLITFTPPIVVTEASDLVRRKATIIVTQTITTDRGIMKIMCMAPSQVFATLFRERGVTV